MEENKKYDCIVQITSAEYRELVTQAVEAEKDYAAARSRNWELEREISALKNQLAEIEKELDSYKSRWAHLTNNCTTAAKWGQATGFGME